MMSDLPRKQCSLLFISKNRLRGLFYEDIIVIGQFCAESL